MCYIIALVLKKEEKRVMGFINWIDGLSKGMKILVFFPIWGWVFGFKANLYYSF
jgi:hypothetical protein